MLYRDRSAEGHEESLPEKKAGIVTASKLNIRSSPNISAPTVAQPLQQGTIVEIIQETHGWYEVNIQKRGWIKKDYVRT